MTELKEMQKMEFVNSVHLATDELIAICDSKNVDTYFDRTNRPDVKKLCVRLMEEYVRYLKEIKKRLVKDAPANELVQNASQGLMYLQCMCDRVKAQTKIRKPFNYPSEKPFNYPSEKLLFVFEDKITMAKLWFNTVNTWDIPHVIDNMSNLMHSFLYKNTELYKKIETLPREEADNDDSDSDSDYEEEDNDSDSDCKEEDEEEDDDSDSDSDSDHEKEEEDDDSDSDHEEEEEEEERPKNESEFRKLVKSLLTIYIGMETSIPRSKKHYYYYAHNELDDNMTEFEGLSNCRKILVRTALNYQHVPAIMRLFQCVYDDNYWFFVDAELSIYLNNLDTDKKQEELEACAAYDVNAWLRYFEAYCKCEIGEPYKKELKDEEWLGNEQVYIKKPKVDEDPEGYQSDKPQKVYKLKDILNLCKD